MKRLTPARLARLDDDALLAYLRTLADELGSCDDRQKELWDARIAVYREGRSRKPRITHRRMAEAAGVSEVAIITKLKQLSERAGG